MIVRASNLRTKGTALMLMVLGGVASVALAGPAEADSAPLTQLTIGQVLASGSEIQSQGGQVVLTMQTDGNLVLSSPYSVLWNSQTWGHPGAWLQFQPDGNLVVESPEGVALWSSMRDAAGRAGGVVLNVQDDGNLVQYTAGYSGVAYATMTQYVSDHLQAGGSLAPGQALRSPNSQYTLRLEADGALVHYVPDGSWDWRTPAGTSAARFAVQTDGNLVLYDGSAIPWASYTQGTTAAALFVQDDGNVVLYTPTMGVIWASATATNLVRPSTPPPATTPAPPTSWACAWSTTCLQMFGFNPAGKWWGQSMCANAVGFNCTNYVAYRLATRGVQSFMAACGHTRVADATGWDDNARACGIRVDTIPEAGAVLQWDGGAPSPSGSGSYSSAGHVAYIDSVANGNVYISEASCSMQEGAREVLAWPVRGLGSAVEVIHP